MNNFNKKSNFYLFFEVLITISVLIFLLILKINYYSAEDLGKNQKLIINALNTKFTDLLTLNRLADYTLKIISQQELANHAGFFYSVDSSTDSYDIGPCGDYVYPLLDSDCFPDLHSEFISLFSSKLRGLLLDLNYDADFDLSFYPGTDILIGSFRNKHLLLSDEEQSFVVPRNINNSILQSNNKDFLSNLKTYNINNIHAHGCAGFIVSLIKVLNNGKTFDNCQRGDAWDIAACYLKNKPNRVIYSGSGLNYNDLKDIVKPGDMLFLSNPSSWCKYTGYNAYIQPDYPDFDIDSVSSSCSNKKGSHALRTNPYRGYCIKDTIDENHEFCDFNENDISVQNFPIITHIMLVYDLNPVKIVHKWGSNKREDLKNFLSRHGIKVKLIVRPEYG